MRYHTKRLFACILIAAMMLSFTGVFSDTTAGAKSAIRLKEKDFYIEEGTTAKIVVKHVPKKAKITYKSKDKSVAAVTKKGVIKGKGEGDTVIIVKVKLKKKLLKKFTCNVNVFTLDPKPTNSPETTYVPIVSEKFTGDKEAKLDEKFVDQVQDFSVNLFKACATKDVESGENVLISPQSVLTDMMMATNGAKTTTLAELEKVMCGSIGFTDFRKSLSDMNAGMIYSDPVRFHIANSIWIRDEADRIKVKQEFIDDGEKWFNADSYVLPFDEMMVSKVNDWVNTHTFGMIPVLLQNTPPEADVMHLINALAFEAPWAEAYTDYQVTKDQTFTNSKGNKEKATMLSDMLKSYLHDDKAVGFSRSYKGWDYSFVTILPDEKTGVSGYLKAMDGNTFRNFYKSSTGNCKVYTHMPEFTYDYSTNMNDGLKEMGIREAFTEGADFTGMADTKSGALYIGNVTHKTHIELDKNGTKAAAVTDISMNDTTSVEPEPMKEITIRLDRPFIYAIVQSDTGIPVFMGVVNSVEKKGK